MTSESKPARKDAHGRTLLRRMHFKHGAYWYVHNNKWTRLAADYLEALIVYQKYVNIEVDFPALVDRVLAYLHAKGTLTPNSWQQYNGCAGHIKDAFDGFMPREVTAPHVAAFHDDMIDTPNMANRCLTLINHVCERGVAWGEMLHNPAHGIRRHKENKRTRYLNDAEFKAIRNAAKPWIRNLIDFLYLTGQRVGDVLVVRLADISESGVYFQQGKGGARLLVEMSNELAAVIASQRKINGLAFNPFLFHPKGKQTAYGYESARVGYRDACKLANVADATIHDIRAKSLSDADDEGKDAQKLGGHSSPQMTKRYLRLIQTKTVQGPRGV